MTRTPDHTPAPSVPEYTDEERKIFSLDRLEQSREYQKALLAEHRNKATDASDTYVREFNSGIEDSLRAYLGSQGINSDSPHYDYIISMYRNAAIDRINDEQWYTSPAARGENPDDTQSQRDVFSESVRNVEGLMGDSSDPDDPDSDPAKAEKEREIQEARKAVEEMREEWSTASAKRQGKLFSRGNMERTLIREAYDEEVNKLGRLELADVINDDEKTDDEKNVAVVEYLFKEQAELRKLTTEKLKGTKVSKLIKWMNKGGIVKRIVKGVAIGAAAGVVGTALAGGLGVGAAVAGVTTVGTRFMRGYALGDKDKRGMATAEESIDKDEIAAQLNDTDVEGDKFDKAGLHFNGFFEDDTRREQNKRRKSALVGLGMVAVGAGAGYGLHAGAEAASQHFAHHGLQVFHPLGHADGAHYPSGHSHAQGGETSPSQPVDTSVELPSVKGEYPWNRMQEAISKGIINPPHGMGAEQSLHHYAHLLETNGDNVQWDHLPGGREYLVVNGHDNTDYVWKHVMVAAAKAGDVANR